MCLSATGFFKWLITLSTIISVPRQYTKWQRNNCTSEYQGLRWICLRNTPNRIVEPNPILFANLSEHSRKVVLEGRGFKPNFSVNFVTYLNQIMAYSSENPIVQLKKCLMLAQDVGSHAEATRAFEQLCGIIDAENPMAAQLLEMLWEEAIMARRSALFWQQMSDVEKDMANRMMENMTQMRQNYLRLMQEM